MPPEHTTLVRTVRSFDGTPIAYHRRGAGPGLVIVPGSMSPAADYAPLARALAGSYTVYVMDRRGHGASGPIGAHHSMATESADLAMVLRTTGARLLFGHSIGGLIALYAAGTTPVRGLVLYEPPLSVHGSIPDNWLPRMERALARGRHATAMAAIMKGLSLSGALGRLPGPALTALIAAMMRLRRGPDGRPCGAHLAALLPTMAVDMALVRAAGDTQDRFRDLSTPTLLLGGDRSAPHFALAVRTLAGTLPHARRVILPGLDHSAPNHDAPRVVARELSAFLAGVDAPAPQVRG